MSTEYKIPMGNKDVTVVNAGKYTQTEVFIGFYTYWQCSDDKTLHSDASWHVYLRCSVIRASPGEWNRLVSALTFPVLPYLFFLVCSRCVIFVLVRHPSFLFNRRVQLEHEAPITHPLAFVARNAVDGVIRHTRQQPWHLSSPPSTFVFVRTYGRMLLWVASL